MYSAKHDIELVFLEYDYETKCVIDKIVSKKVIAQCMVMSNQLDNIVWGLENFVLDHFDWNEDV